MLKIDSLSSPIFTIDTKAVSGLASDPFNDYRFSSFGDDGNIRLWDLRIPKEPIININTGFRYGLAHVSWCPTQKNILLASGKDSKLIKLLTINGNLDDTETQDLKSRDDSNEISDFSNSLTFKAPKAYLSKLVVSATRTC